MAARTSATDRKAPRLRRRLVGTAMKPPTALSNEAEVADAKRPARMEREPLPHGRLLVGGVVVEDRLDCLACGNLRARCGIRAMVGARSWLWRPVHAGVSGETYPGFTMCDDRHLKTNIRFDSLDLIRGLAALAVLSGHLRAYVFQNWQIQPAKYGS